MIAAHYLLVIHRSFGSPVEVSLAFLVWWGAWICSEHQVRLEQPAPTRVGLFLGSLVLVLCVIRGNHTVHPDNLILLLAPVEGAALAALHQPLHRLVRFRPSFFILSLLYAQSLLYRLLSLQEPQINRLSAAASGLLLRLIGKEVAINGSYVLLPTGGVSVYGPCNGADKVCLLMVVAIVFLICFPLRRWVHRLLVVAAAPLVALISNSVRIAFLALFAASPSPESDAMFDFFHDDAGSLIFSGVAVSLMAILYLGLLHDQFSRRGAPNVS